MIATDPSLWVSVGAAVGAVASAVIAFVSQRVAVGAISSGFELALISEYRSDSARNARKQIIPLKRGAFEPGGFDAQSRKLRAAALSVAHFYDHVGLLIALGSVREKPFVIFMGLSAHQCWTVLAELIIEERKKRGDPLHLKQFEKFANHRLPKDLRLIYEDWLRRSLPIPLP